MEKLLIPLGIMVGLSILGWLTQKLKNTQDRKQVERERERRAAAGPVVQSSTAGAGPRAGANDLSRFMEEIDKLRQRGPGGAPPSPLPQAKPIPKAIPVVAAKKKVRLGESLPSTFETTAAPIQSRSINPADDLPVASVVPPTFAPPTVKPLVARSGASVVTAAVKPLAGATKYKERGGTPTTPFGRQLVALLGSPQSLPMAVVLQEILGPPKSQQNLGTQAHKSPPLEEKQAEESKADPEVKAQERGVGDGV